MSIKFRLKPKGMSAKSHLEEDFALVLRDADMPQPTREYRFHPTRKWRFDFAWVEEKIAVEVEGGIWNSGRHSRGYGMEADMEKYNEATSLGWKVFRISGKHIASRKDILRWIAGALAT